MPKKPKKETLRAIRKRMTGFGQKPYNEIVGPIRTRAGRKNPNFRADWIVADALAINRNPAAIVDHVSDYLLAAHAEAILRGQKADGSGPQAKLKSGEQKELARKGKRKDARGILSGGFARNLTRGKIRIRGGKLRNGDDATIAKCRIKVMRPKGGTGARDEFGNSGDYPAWIAKESRRGIEFFFTTGAIAAGVDLAIRQFLDLGIRDQVRDPDFREYRSPDTKA